MTTEDAAGLLAVAIASYPAAADRVADPKALARGWAMALDDIPLAVAEQALRRHLRSSKWLPTPAEIRELVGEASGAIPSEGEAWAMVLRHIREVSYINPTPFAAPQPVLDAVRAVGGISALRRSEDPEGDRKAFGFAYRQAASRALRETDLYLAASTSHALGTGA